MSLSDTPVALHYVGLDTEGYMFSIASFQPIPPAVADANRRFNPPTPSSKPKDLFSVKWNKCSLPGYRFVRTNNSKQMLMFVDGSSLGNGLPHARAGYGVVFAPRKWSYPLVRRLEQDGSPQSSNRAELHAVLGALGLRFWLGEGFEKIVIASDSQYVVNGISERILTWRKNGWKTSTGAPVANLDLWEKLQAKLREMERSAMLVQFWWIPREWNKADRYAKAGAEEEAVIGDVPTVVAMERILTDDCYAPLEIL